MRPVRTFSAALAVFIIAVLFAGTIPLGAQTDLREAQGRNGPISEEDDVPLRNWAVPAPVATLSANRTIVAMALPSAASHHVC